MENNIKGIKSPLPFPKSDICFLSVKFNYFRVSGPIPQLFFPFATMHFLVKVNQIKKFGPRLFCSSDRLFVRTSFRSSVCPTPG